MNKNRPETEPRRDGALTESEVGLMHPAEAFVQDAGDDPVTHVHVIVDGDRDEEAVTLSPWAGASSEATASSGIPSALTQHHQWSEKTE